VNISSIVGKVSVPCTGWYSASKHAVEAVSDALRVEVKPFGIHVVVIEPGPIKTEFDDIALNMLDQSNDPLAYALLKRRFRKFIESTYSKAPAPDIIARAVVKVVTSKNPRARYAIPLTSRLLIWARQILGDQILDQMIERQLRA
jgi:short-subunit dehydrogenase